MVTVAAAGPTPRSTARSTWDLAATAAAARSSWAAERPSATTVTGPKLTPTRPGCRATPAVARASSTAGQAGRPAARAARTGRPNRRRPGRGQGVGVVGGAVDGHHHQLAGAGDALGQALGQGLARLGRGRLEGGGPVAAGPQGRGGGGRVGQQHGRVGHAQGLVDHDPLEGAATAGRAGRRAPGLDGGVGGEQHQVVADRGSGRLKLATPVDRSSLGMLRRRGRTGPGSSGAAAMRTSPSDQADDHGVLRGRPRPRRSWPWPPPPTAAAEAAVALSAASAASRPRPGGPRSTRCRMLSTSAGRQPMAAAQPAARAAATASPTSQAGGGVRAAGVDSTPWPCRTAAGRD